MKSMKLNLMRYVMKNSFKYKFVCVQSSLCCGVYVFPDQYRVCDT